MYILFAAKCTRAVPWLQNLLNHQSQNIKGRALYKKNKTEILLEYCQVHVGLYLWFEGRGYPSSLQVSPAEVSVEGGRHHLTGITRPWPQPKACSKHGKQIIHGAFLKALKYFLLKRALPGPHSNRLKQFRNLFCIHEDIRLQISKFACPCAIVHVVNDPEWHGITALGISQF